MRASILALAAVLFATLEGGCKSATESLPTYPFGEQEGVTLSADGDSKGTYALMERVGYGIESPDFYGVHTEVQHITQRFDKELKWYVFDFKIHIDEDDDRGIATTTDRQRNEIRARSASVPALAGYEGESVRYHWYFRIPEGWQTTASFCHIHQIKGVGGVNINNPIITFSTVTKASEASGQQFQIRHMVENVSASEYLCEMDLSPFIGEWCEVRQSITYGYDGRYSVEIVRCSDGEQLVKIEDAPIKGWREGISSMQPKWGVYRYFGANGMNKHLLRDEMISFAEFNVEK